MRETLHRNKVPTATVPKLQVCFILFAMISFTLTTTGCDSDLPNISWEGENVRFANGHDAPPCGNTLQRLDDLVGDLEDALKLNLPEGTKITYYWLPTDEAERRCRGRRGCSGETVVISDDPINVHELVHAITHSMGLSHLFLYEGLAVAFGDMPFYPPLESLESDFDGLIKQNLVPYLSYEELDYRAAGFFVRYLVETYGIKKTKEILILSTLKSDYQNLNGIFLHVLGVSLDNILEEIAGLSLNETMCYLSPPSCSSSTELWMVTPQWEQTIQVECSEKLVIGPFTQYRANGLVMYNEDGEYQIPLVFQISEAGTYWLDTSESTISSGLGFIRPCFFNASCDWSFGIAGIGDYFTGSQSFFAYFEPGYYQVDFHLHSEGILNVSFEKID